MQRVIAAYAHYVMAHNHLHRRYLTLQQAVEEVANSPGSDEEDIVIRAGHPLLFGKKKRHRRYLEKKAAALPLIATHKGVRKGGVWGFKPPPLVCRPKCTVKKISRF